MPPKQQQKRRNQGRTNNKRGPWSGKQLTCIASGREAAYTVATINGSGGVLLPNTGTAATTDTGGRYTIIDCASLGARVAQLSRLYNQWKVRRIKFQFRPESFNIGTQSLSTITQFPLQGYLGVGLDPTMGLLVQQEIVESGGREFNFARPASVTMGTSGWLYTQPRASDTLSDNRFISPGILQMQRNANGTETSITLGQLEVLWDIEFRYPVDADEEGVDRGVPLFGQALLDRRNNLLKELDQKHNENDMLRCEEKQLRRSSLESATTFGQVTGPSGLAATLRGCSAPIDPMEDSPILISTSKVLVSQKPQSIKPRLKIAL